MDNRSFRERQSWNIGVLLVCLLGICIAVVAKATLESNTFLLRELCAKYDFNEDNDIDLKDFAMFAQAYSECAAIKKAMYDAQHPQLVIDPNMRIVKEYGVDFNDLCFVDYYLNYKSIDQRSIDAND